VNKRIFFYVFIYLVFSNSFLYSQAQLIQSFIEQNNKEGDTKFGFSVSAGGDVNNDGYDDIIIGAYGYNDYTGRVYIYYGGNPMDSSADIIMTGEGKDNHFGIAVSTAGDINNDGFDDIIVGASFYNTSTGRVYLYYGGSSMNNIADIIITGEGVETNFGCSTSFAGDINKDGYDDILVGAYGYNNHTGRAYLYYGGSPMDDKPDIIFTGEGESNEFGISVSNNEDVNNDGYDDITIGAHLYGDNTGRVYIYYGSSMTDNNPDIILTGETRNNHFGRAISSGDINNDGFDDVLVGAYGYNDYMGRVYIYYGGNSIDDKVDIIISGEETDSMFGISVSSGCDINNDNYDDVIVGASNYNNNTGRAYIYYGANTIDNIADIIITGEGVYNEFGRSVSMAGDINNDGYNDIIVGAYGYDHCTGRAYIYYGASTIDNIIDIIITGEGKNNNFGYSISTAGDVNNDGYDDVIIGAKRYNNYTGRAYIYFGGAMIDNNVDVILTGEKSHDYFGYSVSTAGDINNDGFDDVIVGAYGYKSYTGCIYIYFGGNLMDNVSDINIVGKAIDDNFGYSVSTAGDVNNDGYDDVLVGNNGNGTANIYFGGSPMDVTNNIALSGYNSSVSTAGDVNNDGYDDIIVGNPWFSLDTADNIGRALIYYGGDPMDSIPDVTLMGKTKYSHLGQSVSTAGDVNNDGYDDVIVGTGANSFNNTPGFAYIFYGNSSMDSIADVTVTVNPPSDYFGCSVSNAGDINNDEYSDVIVGDYLFDSYRGRAFIYYGGEYMDSVADITITGESENNYLGFSVSNAGDVNNDGYDDFIVGAYNYPFNGKAYIYSDPNAPLPVELTTFTYSIFDDCKVKLNWSTTIEVNNYGFELERQMQESNKKTKEQKQNWKKIVFIEGHGNSNSPKFYEFVDNTVTYGKYKYRLKQIDLDGKYEYSKIIEADLGLPGKFELSQNYPNPFNPTTTIQYNIPRSKSTNTGILGNSASYGVVTLKIYNIIGEEVATLVNQKQNPGSYQVKFDATNLPSGVYFYRIIANNFTSTKKMILLR